jgi:bacteriocin-like protein
VHRHKRRSLRLRRDRRLTELSETELEHVQGGWICIICVFCWCAAPEPDPEPEDSSCGGGGCSV